MGVQLNTCVTLGCFVRITNFSSACRSIICPMDELFDKLVVKTLLEFNLCIQMFIYWPWPVFLPSTMTVTHKLFKILRGHFLHKCYCDLDPKMYRDIYWEWPIFLPSTTTVTQKLFKVLRRHGYCIKCYCDLDIWPTDLKSYRGQLLTMTNLPTK